MLVFWNGLFWNGCLDKKVYTVLKPLFRNCQSCIPFIMAQATLPLWMLDNLVQEACKQHGCQCQCHHMFHHIPVNLMSTLISNSNMVHCIQRLSTITQVSTLPYISCFLIKIIKTLLHFPRLRQLLEQSFNSCCSK